MIFNADREGFLAGFNDIVVLGALLSFAGAALALCWSASVRSSEPEETHAAAEREALREAWVQG